MVFAPSFIIVTRVIVKTKLLHKFWQIWRNYVYVIHFVGRGCVQGSQKLCHKLFFGGFCAAISYYILYL